MEPALGLSYPTIRNRISSLKEKLTLPSSSNTEPAKTEKLSVDAILKGLETGSLNFESAFEQLKSEGSRS